MSEGGATQSLEVSQRDGEEEVSVHQQWAALLPPASHLHRKKEKVCVQERKREDAKIVGEGEVVLIVLLEGSVAVQAGR